MNTEGNMLKINETTNNACCTLAFDGNLDESTCSAMEERLLSVIEKNDIADIVLNLSNVKYISSIGIRVLILAHKKAAKSNKKISITEPSHKAREILEMVGILTLFAGEGGRV